MHTHRLSGLASIMISCLLPLLFVNGLAGGREEAYRLASTQQHHSNRSFPREPKGRPTAGFMAGSLHSCIVWLNRTRERLLSGCGWFGSVHKWEDSSHADQTTTPWSALERWPRDLSVTSSIAAEMLFRKGIW